MTKKELFEKLKEIINVQFSIGSEDKEVLLSSILIEDFKADELDIIEIVMELEDELEISIDDRHVEKWNTIKDIYNYLCKTINIKEIINLPVISRFELLDIRK